jgi:hypothetical protein
LKIETIVCYIKDTNGNTAMHIARRNEKMIHICKPHGKAIRSFESDDIFNHLSAGELLEDHPDVDKTHWGFVIFPPEDVPHLFFKLKKESITPMIRQAYAGQLGIIEICTGDYANPTWVPLTPGVDVGNFKKDWYVECCKEHGYLVTESHSGDALPDTRGIGDAL